MIEHLRRQLFRSLHSGGLAFGVIESCCCLNKRIETTPLSPWAGVPVGRQRHVHDTRIDPRGILGREAKCRQRMRPVALRKNICLRQEVTQRTLPLLPLELDKTCQLAASGVDREPRNRG